LMFKGPTRFHGDYHTEQPKKAVVAPFSPGPVLGPGAANFFFAPPHHWFGQSTCYNRLTRDNQPSQLCLRFCEGKKPQRLFQKTKKHTAFNWIRAIVFLNSGPGAIGLPNHARLLLPFKRIRGAFGMLKNLVGRKSENKPIPTILYSSAFFLAALIFGG